MDIAAERARWANIQMGIIPENQLTDDEKALLQQQAQQPKEPSPEMVLAGAEDKKANADLMNAENKNLELQIKATETQAKIENAQRGTENDTVGLMLEQQTQQADLLKKQAETLTELATGFKTWREGMGVDGLVGPNAMEAAIQQAEIGNQATEQTLESLPEN
jgi:hypothetical protein